MATRISWDTDAQAAALKAHLAQTCDKIVELSKAWSPPGPNAANGYFRDHMNSDEALKALTEPVTRYDDPIVKSYYDITYALFDGLKHAFEPQNHQASAASSPGKFISALSDLVANHLPALIGDVIAVVVGPPPAKAAAIQQIEKEFSDIVEEVKKRNFIWSGAHANGWIGTNVSGVAAEISRRISALPVPAQSVAEYKAIIEAICAKLSAIPLANFEPWLNSEWQLGFQAVMEAGAKAARGV